MACWWLRWKPSLAYIPMRHTRQTIEIARVYSCPLRRASNPRQDLILIFSEISAWYLALLGWELQNLIFKHFILSEVMFPRLDTIRRLLTLQSPENSLVFCSNLHQSFLSCISIETWNFKSFCYQSATRVSYWDCKVLAYCPAWYLTSCQAKFCFLFRCRHTSLHMLKTTICLLSSTASRLAIRSSGLCW